MKFLSLCALCVFAAPGYLFAQQTPSAAAAFPDPNAPLTVHPLRGGAYWIEGGIGNTAFVVTDAGVVVFDTQFFAQTARNELAEIARVTDQPVVQILLSHSDPDHVLGMSGFPQGIPIAAQENAAAEIRHEIESPSNPAYPWLALVNYLPTREIKHQSRLVIGGMPVVLLHVAPAHTDGDMVAYLPRQRIVFAGDILTPGVGPYPGIHLDKHGSSLGWIMFARALLRLDADIFISGHGEPLTRAQVEERIVAAEKRRAEIEAMVARGMTLEQIKAVFNDAPATGAAAMFPGFTETTYEELTSEPSGHPGRHGGEH